MVIYPSKIKVLITNFIKSQLTIFFILYLYPYYLNPSVSLQVFFSIVVGVVYTFAYLDYSVFNVNINENDRKIGALKAVLFNRGKTIYIDKKNVDVGKSLKRTLFEKIVGRYTVYDLDGLGFKVFKYYYSRPEFEKIKFYLKTFLALKFNEETQK